MSATTSYRVSMLPEVYDKIMWWVNRSPIEISGFGKVQFINGVPTVTSAYLVEQVNTSADTEIDDKALSKLMYQTREDAGHMNFWWHSHVNMGVFWSGTDHAAIEQIGKHGWCLATVFNKKAEQRTAIYQGGSDFFPPIWVDNLDLEIATRMNQEIIDNLEAEYTAKCSTKTYPLAGSKVWKTGQKWCYEKQDWAPEAKAKTYADIHGVRDKWDWEDDGLDGVPLKGKQMSLISMTTGTITGDEGVILPTKHHASDGHLEVMTLDETQQLEVAGYYEQMYGEFAEEWWDLEEFYQWYYDDFKKEFNLPNKEGARI